MCEMIVYIFFVLLMFLQMDSCVALRCNYCYNADTWADCMINVKTCEIGQICYVEIHDVTYKSRRSQQEKKFNRYKMDCSHYSLCRDRVTRGPDPYGYAVINGYCCCSDRCEKADGVGQGHYEVCPYMLMVLNGTITNAVSPRTPDYVVTWMSTVFSFTCAIVNVLFAR